MNHLLLSLIKISLLLLFLQTSVFVLAQTASGDVGVIEISSPQSIENEADTVDVVVEVRNFGVDSIFLFDIAYQINIASPVITPWSGIMAPGDTNSIILPSIIIPAGNSTFCAYTVLSGDTVSSNDSLCQSVFGAPLNNVAMSSIMSLPQIQGYYPVYAIISNPGILPLQSAIIEWKIDTSQQTSYNWSGNIAPGAESEALLLGYYNFNDSLFNLKVNTSLPNGLIDFDSINDTISTDMSFFNVAVVDTFPYCESFETNYVNWIQNTWDDFDWTQNSNGTPTSQTGPASAFDGTFYMFTESSNPQQTGDIASIEAMFDFTNFVYPEIVFNYNMNGTQMGTLHVDIYDTIWHEDVWTMSGNLGTNWLQANIGILEYGGNDQIVIRIRGERGTGSRGDLAIDNFCFNSLFSDDIGIIEVNGGSESLCGNISSDLLIEINNFGATDQSNIPIELIITDPSGSSITYLDTTNTTLNSLSSESFIFSNVDLSASGQHNFVCISNLANDSNLYNDTLTGQFYVISPINIIPFLENFELNNSYFHLEDASLSYAEIHTDTIANNSYIRLAGGESNQFWTGSGNNVTSQNAWIDNVTHVASARSCNIDASTLSGLMLDLDLRQTNTYGYTDYSWFRVLINDTLQIADINGISNFNSITPVSDPFNTITFNLSQFAGTVFTITLQASNKYDETVNGSYPDGDQVLIDNISLYEPSSLDAGVVQIIEPTGSLCGNINQYINVMIGNYGISDIFDIPVQVILTSSTGVQTVTSTLVDTLQNGDMSSILVGPFDMSVADNYIINVQSLLLNDGNATNDILEESVSTISGISSLPFVEDFTTAGSFFFGLADANLASAFYFNDNGDTVLRMEGGNINAGWTGNSTNTTPTNAWIDNVQHHAYASSCTINAAGFPFLNLDIDFRQTAVVSYLQYSWFRVLINDTIQIADNNGIMNFNPIQAQGDPYQVHTFDLSAFGGTEFTLTLQSSCKYDSTLTSGGTTYIEGDAVYIRSISIHEPPAVDIKVVSIDGVPESGCDLGVAQITVNFINNGTDTLLMNDIIPFFLGVNTIAYPESYTLTNDMAYGDSASYTFNAQPVLSDDGEYMITVWCEYTGDTIISNNSISDFTTNILSIDTYPYFQNFESNANGWRSETIDGNTSWELGTPDQTNLDSAYSGISAWMTDLDANYSSSSETYLYTPCYDFSFVMAPYISVWLNVDSQEDTDGMILEGSVDNGVTWIKVGGTDSTFYSSFNNAGYNPVIINPWWTGVYGGWVEFSTIAIEYAGEPNVKFRFRFESNNYTNSEGVAIDDFFIDDIFLCEAWTSELVVCEGDSVSLEVSTTGGVPPFTYIWSPSAILDDPFISSPMGAPVTNTTFSVVITDDVGEQTQCGIIVEVLPAPFLDLGPDLVVDYFVTLDAGSGYASYLWSTGDTTQTISLEQYGNYSINLVVTDVYGCQGYDDIEITIYNEIGEFNVSNLVKVYPNPADDKVIIELPEEIMNSDIILSDITGKAIQMSNIIRNNNSYEMTISHLTAGTYFITLRNKNTTIVKKLIIE